MTMKKEMQIELRGENEVVVTRYFAAPRALVFDCHTKPDLMRRWLIGPPGMTLEIRTYDLRVGGKYLYVYADQKGGAMGVYGKFTELQAPEKVANTENYAMDLSQFDANAAEDPNATVESRTFTPEAEGTLLTHVTRFASAETRRLALESGATEGWVPLYAELDKFLAELS